MAKKEAVIRNWMLAPVPTLYSLVVALIGWVAGFTTAMVWR